MPGQARQVPERFRSWYFVCRSDAVRRGEVRSIEFLGRPAVLFRTTSGSLHALSAHCSHMGANLGQGRVIGERIRCPLHHWEYDGQGVCRRIPATEAIPEHACQASYPVSERYGGVFVFNGPQALFPPPLLSEGPPKAYRAGAGRSTFIECPASVLIANAFDIQHLQTVHERALREPPLLSRPDRHRLVLRYVSRVTGSRLSDRAMRLLSRDRIAVTITCWGGSTLMIESDLGRARSALVVGALPRPDGVEVTLLCAVRRSPWRAWDRARLRAAHLLFGGFLQRDVAILDGMRFRPHLLLPEDAVLRECLSFLRELADPAAAPDAARAYA